MENKRSEDFKLLGGDSKPCTLASQIFLNLSSKIGENQPAKELLYSVYYQKIDKKKLNPLENGVLILKSGCIYLLSENHEEILEKIIESKVTSFENNEVFQISNFEIEIISQVPNSKIRSVLAPVNSSPRQQLIDHPSSRKSPEIIKKPQFLIIPEGALVLDECKKAFVDPSINKFLKNHQREGIQFLYDCVTGIKVPKHYGGILADAMGLGKTLTTLALISALTRQGSDTQSTFRKCVVICPATLVDNWELEVRKWFHERFSYVKVSGAKSEKKKKIDMFCKSSVALLIVSYETFTIYAGVLDKVCDFVICDEAHKIKNHLTRNYKAIDGLKCKHRVLITGTPLQNYIREFFTCLNLVNENILGSWDYFKYYYAKVIQDAQEPKASEKKKELALERSQELWKISKTFMLRRTGDILQQTLPPKHEYIVFLQLCELQEHLYLNFLKSKIAHDAVANGYNESVLALIDMLRKITNHPDFVYFREPKCNALHVDWKSSLNFFSPDYSENFDRSCFSIKVQFVLSLATFCISNKEKLIIVSNYTKVLDMIQPYLDNKKYRFLRLDGKTMLKNRTSIISEFNDYQDHSILLLSSKAGGCGLNIIGASRMVLFDPDWNPKNDQQAMARVWREGQKKEVHIYRLFIYGTIEEKMLQRQTSKDSLSLHVVDAQKKSSLFSKAFLKEIFTFNKTVQSPLPETELKLLKNSWLDLMNVNIGKVCELKPEWEDLKEEKCILSQPKASMSNGEQSQRSSTTKKNSLIIDN